MNEDQPTYRYECRSTGMLSVEYPCHKRRAILRKKPHQVDPDVLLSAQGCRGCEGAKELEVPLAVVADLSPPPALRNKRPERGSACDTEAGAAGPKGNGPVRHPDQKSCLADSGDPAGLPGLQAFGQAAAPGGADAGAGQAAETVDLPSIAKPTPSNARQRKAATARALGGLIRARVKRLERERRRRNWPAAELAARDVEDLAKLLATLVGG